MIESPSLKKQIEIFTSRGNQFLSQAVESGSKDAYAKAIQEFVSSYKFALLLNSRDGMEQICAFNLGAAHIAGGDTTRGISVLHTILEHGTPVRMNSSMPSLQSGKGDVHFNLAIGYEKIDDIENATNFYQRALLEYGNRDKNEQKIAETHLKLANIFNKQKDFSETRKHFSRASDLYQKLGDNENMVLALVCQANAAVSDTTVSRDECIRLLDSCCKKSAALKHNNLQGKILCEVGLMYSTLGCLNRGLLCFEKSIRLCDKNTNPRRRAIALQNSGAILNTMGYYAESIPRHSESAQLHGSLGNRNAQGQSFCNLAFAQSQIQYSEDAWESYLHALQAFKDTDDKQGQWQCHEGLGSIAFNNGRLERAVQHFTLALSCQTQNDKKESRNRLVRKLTNALEMRADRKVTAQSPQLAIEESKEKYEGTPLESTVPLSPIILQDDVPDGNKSSQKITHTRHYKKKKKSLVRGRRKYSDENDRPVQHIARGISNLTQNSNPFADRFVEERDGYRSDNSTASSELRAVFDMPRTGVFTSSDSESDDENKKALSKPRHRRKLRNLVEASTMPINALTSNRDTKTPDSTDSTPRTDGTSEGNLTQVYRDQLHKIEEKADEEDFTSVTSKSTDSSSSDSGSEDEKSPCKKEELPKKITPVKPERTRVRIASDAIRAPPTTSALAPYVNEDQPLYARSVKQTTKLNETNKPMTQSTHLYESIKTSNMASPTKSETTEDNDEKDQPYDEVAGEMKQDEETNSNDDIRPLSSLYSGKNVKNDDPEPSNSGRTPAISDPISVVHTFDPPTSYSSSYRGVDMQNRPLPSTSESTNGSKQRNSKKKSNQSRACSIM